MLSPQGFSNAPSELQKGSGLVFLLPGLHRAAAGTSIHPVHSTHKSHFVHEHIWNRYTYIPTAFDLCTVRVETFANLSKSTQRAFSNCVLQRLLKYEHNGVKPAQWYETYLPTIVENGVIAGQSFDWKSQRHRNKPSSPEKTTGKLVPVRPCHRHVTGPVINTSPATSSLGAVCPSTWLPRHRPVSSATSLWELIWCSSVHVNPDTWIDLSRPFVQILIDQI
ncbi:hypothetical protein OIU76_027766 [Salix suchowensis]|nr:hypothetical protein OIU76_027766 [Salix suchowensis]